MDLTVLFLGILIFFARILDVSLGTIRTIAIVHSRIPIAFLLGVVEVSIWVIVVAQIIPIIKKEPILILFYAVGFATGSVVGILVDQKLAYGDVIVRFISPKHGDKIAERIRKAGFPVTVFRGEGMYGPVTLLYMVCSRKNLKLVVNLAQEYEPDIFFATETPGKVRHKRTKSRFHFRTSGWRSLRKGK
jgi:uncharacterized protein YebE (UPF0316 family)